MFNVGYDRATYSAGLLEIIVGFVTDRGGITADDATSWANDLRSLGPDYWSEDDWILNGRGTSNLELLGYPILVDARAAGGDSVTITPINGLRAAKNNVQLANSLRYVATAPRSASCRSLSVASRAAATCCGSRSTPMEPSRSARRPNSGSNSTTSTASRGSP